MTADPAPLRFDHERLDVYIAALEFVVVARDIINGFPRGRSSFADQLERAAASIALNIAEGSGEFSRREKVRFYRIALRSATECAAILDVATRLSLVQEPQERSGKILLDRIAAMLTGLAKRHERE